jgi:nucleoside-diphosphate-sugar epimerase
MRFVVTGGAGFIGRHLADTTKAEKVLGFKAKTSLREGIEKTIRAYDTT